MRSTTATNCPLCGGATDIWFEDAWRGYRRCATCALVHVPARWQLDAVAERAHYDTHRNRIDDPRYRAFLGRLAEPLLERIRLPAEGLDFGCGPGPALAAMLTEHGCRMTLFDRYFQPEYLALERSYDFVTATEVAEHLAEPGIELERLWRCLRPGGWLAVMTGQLPAREDFGAWHYRRDPTHICFFAAETFDYLAWRWQARLERPARDVVLLQKPG